MGEDLDAPMCQEVLDHLKACPTCKVYFDTVKKTVFLCRSVECPEELPEDINDRLLEVLNLKNISKPARK
jgi:predicted anti-sigma-YlaC factor YlaD